MPDKDQTLKESATCDNCGTPKNDWFEGGYQLGSKQYCCQGCAEQTGCTCTSAERATA